MASAHDYRVTKPTHRTPTCDTCRSRHQKCGGEQPQCSNCALRAINCSYRGSKTRAMPVTNVSAEHSIVPSSSRPSISNADYDRLYAEIFGDIVRRLNLGKGLGSGLQEDAVLDARPGNASLPHFHREVSSLVRELVAFDKGLPPLQSDANPMKEPALERNPDHVRKILRDSLPSQNISRHLLDMFFDYQNSILYVCNRVEVEAQLSLMYEDPGRVRIAWFCQMFLIFAVGVQFDDINDTDGPAYHEIGQKYIDDAIDEDPQSTIWVIRVMLLLCIYQPPSKWNSVWMHLDAAIRGAQRFQLDMGQNILKELSDSEYLEWRRIWLTIICFDRWVAIFLGRLPRIKESISRDPLFKEPGFRLTLTETPQSNITTLAIISGDILRDMYFSEHSSLNICRQYKTELESWLSSLPNPRRQFVQSGDVPQSPKDQAEQIFNLRFMWLGAWMLVTRPFLSRILKMETASNFGGSIVSTISAEASLCIDFAFRLINNAIVMLGSSFPPKKTYMPVYFLISATHIMILAAVWKLKLNGGGHTLPGTPNAQSREVAAIDTAIQILAFCGHRNHFARRYSTLLKDLQQQLLALSSNGPLSSISSSASATDFEPTVDGGYFHNLNISVEQSSSATVGISGSIVGQASYPSEWPLNIELDGWSPSQFGTLSPGGEDSHNIAASFLLRPHEHDFWSESME